MIKLIGWESKLALLFKEIEYKLIIEKRRFINIWQEF